MTQKEYKYSLRFGYWYLDICASIDFCLFSLCQWLKSADPEILEEGTVWPLFWFFIYLCIFIMLITAKAICPFLDFLQWDVCACWILHIFLILDSSWTLPLSFPLPHQFLQNTSCLSQLHPKPSFTKTLTYWSQVPRSDVETANYL